MLSTNLLATLRASLLASLAVKHCGHVRTKLQRANYAECTNAFLARANLSRSRISNHLIPHLDCEAAERSAKTEETHCTCALPVYGRPTSHTSDTHLILGSTCWNAFLKPSCSAYGGCLKFHVPGNAIGLHRGAFEGHKSSINSAVPVFNTKAVREAHVSSRATCQFQAACKVHFRSPSSKAAQRHRRGPLGHPCREAHRLLRNFGGSANRCRNPAGKLRPTESFKKQQADFCWGLPLQRPMFSAAILRSPYFLRPTFGCVHSTRIFGKYTWFIPLFLLLANHPYTKHSRKQVTFATSVAKLALRATVEVLYSF